ncbi:DNA gyrase/topoisomerase IV subunit B [Rubinisphaera italica]|uniref:DNA topoisomerase (ATP-hydrolyzing) n=1 Tax=Rubinisphaera italica TaxID=2527969 RepID=A0A5C5XMT6_9PLAN|nr:DNA topoisomerase IV subunit B [Rubinisphaera italica]TWT63889.1 DNA gyrase subunit B [Rubinisphaera italica]
MATATPSNYKASDIEVLEGLEAVRRRPSMYIGGVDHRGLHHLLWEVIDNCVDEFLAGHADTIKVTLHKDGEALTVGDNGRGIPVDKHPKYKKSALEVILTTLHAGGKFSDKNYARSGGLHGVGSSVVNALSSEMVATVHRDGFEWIQRYKRGRPTTPVKKAKPFKGHGTLIYFRPDDEIFRRIAFSTETIRQHLEDISYIHAGLKIRFTDEAKNETDEFYQPDGIKAYIEKLTKDEKKKPVHEVIFSTEKDDGQVKTELVLRWTEATDEQIRSYVNGIRTHAGGTHLNGVRSGILKAVKNYMDVHNVKPKGVSISAEDIREGMLGVVSVFHGDPMFQGQTKEKLNNPEVASIVEGLVRPTLETWLNNNASIADSILGRIILAARARQASRDAVAQVKRKTPGGKRTSLPGKLLDCRSNDAGESELFIVEGDSAGGTAASGRNSRTQAILPLRGKVLNTESLKINKVLANQEISDLVETLGAGVGANFDIHKLRYNRIILLMDADADGYHISTLLLTFFYRHMPELIRQEKLFIAQPPLYRITTSKESMYALDDMHKEQILASLAANRKVEISRFKGLGEMDASQLKETTLDPAKRVLLKVEIESQVDADETFHQLFGKDASERYRIIMSESALADDLDV